jgi:hypothetical protein
MNQIFIFVRKLRNVLNRIYAVRFHDEKEGLEWRIWYEGGKVKALYRNKT